MVNSDLIDFEMFIPRVSGTTCFWEYAEVKMSELKRQLLLTSFIWGFLWFKCPFFRMGIELESKLNLNQEKQFSKHTLITHKYSHGSEDCLSEESLLERIEGFPPMVLEIVGAEQKGRCSTDIYRERHSFIQFLFWGERHEAKIKCTFSQWDT